jgi:hypothetical protein
LGLATFRAELAGARDRFAALLAEFRGRACCSGSGRSGGASTAAGGSLAGSRAFHGFHHGLADGHARAKTCAYSDGATTFVCGGDGDRLRDFVLREFAHVADHVHADALVENLLQLVGQREIFDVEGVQRNAVLGECRFELLADFFGERPLAGCHVEKGNLAICEGVGHFRDDGIAELTFEVGDAIEIAGAADLAVKNLCVGQVVGINAEASQANGAEFLVADGDGIGRAPVLIGLRTRGEKVDVGFERGLEGFVPVLEIGEDRQRLRVQGVEARTERVGDFSFVDEDCVLRVANGELAAVLDFAVLHGVAVGEDAVLGLSPVDDIDKLFGEEIAKAHGTLFLQGDSVRHVR